MSRAAVDECVVCEVLSLCDVCCMSVAVFMRGFSARREGCYGVSW